MGERIRIYRVIFVLKWFVISILQGVFLGENKNAKILYEFKKNQYLCLIIKY